MKYLKRFNEEIFTPEDFIKPEVKPEVCKDCDCIPCQCPPEKEGTFAFFNKMTKEELLDYQDNFDHSFENPAEHDPEYVAWKKACDLKRCFDVESFDRTRKESEFPSKY